MYALDFNTCTPWDVIRRSIVVHPSLYADALFALAHTHARYAETTHDSKARKAAVMALRFAIEFLAGEVARDLAPDL